MGINKHKKSQEKKQGFLLARHKKAQGQKSKISLTANKKSQGQKSKISLTEHKKAQEEITGFVLIIVITIVILLFFLFLYTNNSEPNQTQESYEVENFVNIMLSYTTNCTKNNMPLDLNDLIKECIDKEECSDGRDSCDVLEKDIKGILNKSWDVSKTSTYKGYELNLTNSKGEQTLYIDKANKTINYKSARVSQHNYEISFRVYY